MSLKAPSPMTLFGRLGEPAADAASVSRYLVGVSPEETPVAITRARRVLRNPSEAELAAALDLSD